MPDRCAVDTVEFRPVEVLMIVCMLDRHIGHFDAKNVPAVAALSESHLGTLLLEQRLIGALPPYYCLIHEDICAN